LNPSNLKLLRDAHTIISFVSDGRDAWARNVSRIAPEATLLCVQAPPRGQIADCIHVSVFFLRQFERHAAMHTAVQQIMRSIAERGVGGRSQADGRILIHAGAGAPTKCWPLDQFISLANRLIVAGRKVQFILGETEIEKWPKTDADRLADTAPLQTPSDLVALYQTIRSTSCFIGNDSGPGHLAGIVGVPAVIAFGAGDPNSWKPLGPAVAAVKSGRVDDMYAAVAELLGSVP
jgi:ADP-heptose:LPS heptosyltransferase